MNAKTFKSLHDYSRHGVNIHITCRNGHCHHHGVADAWSVVQWFTAHRWAGDMQGSFGEHTTDHFRCTKCGDRAGSLRPTERPVTVVTFFPANEAGWKALVKRLRG